MQPTNTTSLRSSRNPAETLTIRMAVPADFAALDRLAQLDSARRPERVPMLVAEVGGELRAALALDAGSVIADPFRRTTEHVGLLVERARQLKAPAPRRAARGRRQLGTPQPAPFPRA